MISGDNDGFINYDMLLYYDRVERVLLHAHRIIAE